MNKYQKRALELTDQINKSMFELYTLVDKELSRPEKSFDIMYESINYRFHPSTTDDERSNQCYLRKELLACMFEDALLNMVYTIHDNDQYHERNHWENIVHLVSGADPADHQIEIIKETYTPDLDEQGNPIKAKPLNMDSIYVQWQDESKFARGVDHLQEFEDKIKRGEDV